MLRQMIYMAASLLVSLSNCTVCPPECRCLDHNSIINCHHADVDRVPSPLPPYAIVIDADRNRISALYNESLVGGKSLEIVSLQDNLLVLVDSGAFSRYPALRIVRLGGNRLSSLPATLFSGCQHLQVLDLHGNRLTGAPPDELFYHVHSLLSLNISNNRLTSARLGPGFRYVTQLADIDFSGNDIRTVESNAFLVTRFWDERVERRVVMTSCNLRHMSSAAFTALPILRSLDLGGNPRLARDDLLAAIGHVHTLTKLDVSSGSMFRQSSDLAELFSVPSTAELRLEDLVAVGNGIRTISMNISTAAVVGTLRSLDLSDNELTTLDGALSLLRRLERLSVRGNRLTRIDSNAVAGLNRLTALDVSYNKLMGFDDGALQPLTRLRHLNLADNRLRTLSAAAVPPAIEFLSVRNNSIVSVKFLANLAHLRSVDVSGNGLIRLDAQLFSPHIRSPLSANFSHNEISSIDGRAFADVAFSVLDLAGNRLTRLSLYGADAVEVLRADDNLIRDVDEEIFHATHDLHLANNRLQSLRTSCNNDTKISSSFSPTEISSPYIANQTGTASYSTSSSTVLVLDVSGNNNLGPSLDSKHVICYSLVGLDQLEILRARQAGLRRLPVPLIERLPSLRVLDVADNEISSMPEDVSVAVSRLHKLNLANNRLVELSSLAESLSLHGVDHTVVNLAGNYWHCSCSDVPACRRLTSILDPRARHLHQPRPRCVSRDKSVVEFCHDLITATDNNQTTWCLDVQVFEQRVEEKSTHFRTVFILVAVVLLTVLILMACCRFSRRNIGLRGGRAAGSARRHGYRIVGETALDFTDVR